MNRDSWAEFLVIVGLVLTVFGSLAFILIALQPTP